ncbi:peptidyl-dipeptidase Dcp [Filimonas lacunae]|uniref:Dipeptidyl carboxypeptidase n=1 Tax=Filimonas lacunae TaxID=477680 RepID=A0A173M9A6_9BACT|nr:peptidyl-dipeptidase Dcp [Filimonas lacunae]BAV04100.1 dipeptidyl carboxypeptidase Dcp [Filimonas lacunae]SIT15462.1 peptidyl-dipeptidase Dcp [Filimonas lacunae]
MKRLTYLPAIVFMTVASSCGGGTSTANGSSDSTATGNPFYTASKLPFGTPDFSKIKDSDFKPALEEGIKQQLAEVQQIADNTAAPDFENTLVALEKSGQLLSRVNHVFNLLTGANTNPLLQQLQEDIAPKLAASADAIYLNTKLFNRVAAIYAKRDSLQLDAESKRLVEYYYQKFELAGAKLAEADKEKLKAFNQEEATLAAKFTNQLMAAAKDGSLVVSNKEELAGLPQGTLDAAKDTAHKGADKWVLSLQNTTQQPNLQFLTNRATRQKLFEASWNRAEKSDSNDTRKVIIRLAEIRAQQAKLLGFATYADWKLNDQMAQTPKAVTAFLANLTTAATAKSKQEAAEIQAVIDQQKGGFTLAPWDWDYYAEQVRKAKYDLDENEIKPYFELDKVLQNGVFYAASELYGLSFKERKDLPVYQEDVRVFDVLDKDGSQIGLFYCDYFKRDNKNGGAWMSNLVEQSHLMGSKPVIYNVCNFTKPAAGQPALISFDDVTTMFHEFGHALHGFFANQKYVSLSGTSVARDYVEFPSQFNEHWASDPKVFNHYAVHYQTGAAMPQPLKDKIKKAAGFNQGYALTEALAAAELDMQWHTITAGTAVTDVDKFEATALDKTNLHLPQVPPRYRSSYFLHIWSNGYAAGYYAYSWTSMLEHDAYSWFEEHGGLTRENGQRFRDMILSKGNTENYGVMFRNFRGHDPNVQPMLKNRGLIP